MANRQSKQEARLSTERPSLNRPFNSRDLLCITALLVFTAVILWPLLIGRSLYWGDIMLYFEPMQRFAAAELRAGRVPLWNPYLVCGQPFLGNPQMGVFYPLSFISSAFSAGKYISISTIIHLFLCGLFMYLFLRRWTVRRASALCGALVYMGSSCLVGRIQFPPMIVSAAYCPLVLYCIDNCVDRLTFSRWWTLSLGVCLLSLSAHPQIAYFTLVTASIYGIFRLRTGFAAGTEHDAHRGVRTAWYRGFRIRVAAWMALAGVIGLCIASVQLLPTLQLSIESTRERLSASSANRFIFDLSHLLTLIWPYALGHPVNSDYFGGGNAWEPGIFIGWVPVGAVILAVWSRFRSRLVLFWSFFSLISVWLATGTAGGLFWLAFYCVPGLSNFHDPARFLFPATLGFCILTAIGIDAIMSRTRKLQSATATVLVVLTALPLYWYGRDWNPTTAVALDQNSSHRHPLVRGRSYLPAHDVYFRRFVSEGYADYALEPDPHVIADTDMPNVQMREGIETAAGYEPVPVAAVSDIDGLTRLALRRGEPISASLMQLMDVTDLMLPRFAELYNPDFVLEDGRRETTKHVPELSVKLPTARAWIVHSAKHVEGKTRIEAALSAPEFHPEEFAIVSGLGTDTRLSLPEPIEQNASHFSPASVTTISPVLIKISADAGTSPGLLVYSGTCYPGWKAVVDRHPASLVCADGAFLGLPLPPGKHEVLLRYSPDNYRLGLFVLCLAALFGSAAMIAARGSRIPGIRR